LLSNPSHPSEGALMPTGTSNENEINIMEYFERTDSKAQLAFLKSHNHCVLCDSILELQHGFLPETNEIKELAKCPQCQIRNRTRVYTIQ
jgi:hypothetical protein